MASKYIRIGAILNELKRKNFYKMIKLTRWGTQFISIMVVYNYIDRSRTRHKLHNYTFLNRVHLLTLM